MRVDGSLPFHIAKAYGLPASQRVTPLTPAAPATPASRTTAELPDKLRDLVGARVAGPVDFTASSSTQPRDDYVLPLYTRSADRVEAAVAVSIGRSVDVTG